MDPTSDQCVKGSGEGCWWIITLDGAKMLKFPRFMAADNGEARSATGDILKKPQSLVLSRRDDNAEEAPGETSSRTRFTIQEYSHMTGFGWGFPAVEGDGKRHPMELSLLNGYDIEIHSLKAEIRRKKGLSVSSLADSGLFSGMSPEAGPEDDGEECRTPLWHNIVSESPPPTPHSGTCMSLRSFMSRDSGVYAADDVSESSPEAPMDRSFLEELEDLSDPDLSMDSGSVRSEQPQPTTTDTDTFKRSPTRRNTTDSEIDEQTPLPLMGEEGSGCGSSYEDREVLRQEIVDERRRKRLHDLWSACDRLEACALKRSGGASHGVTEVMALVESLSSLDGRLQMLRHDMDNLMTQTRENMHDFGFIQSRANRLAKCTEGSRRRLGEAVELEKVCARLEERLQEEWWAAHCPDLTQQHSYIV